MAKRATRHIERLPRGKHRLAPEQVAESQRTRILHGMIETVSERGYTDARIVDVIRHAGVSRKTFYELFTDKEACFLAAYDVTLAKLMQNTATAYESAPGAPWAERIRLALASLLNQMAENPAEAKFCFVEVLAAGPKALARRDAAMRQFTSFFEAGRTESSIELPGITSLAIVGGMNELLSSEIIHGATAQLPMRLPELMFWVTHPFLGTKRAAKERERARQLMQTGAAPEAAAAAAQSGAS